MAYERFDPALLVKEVHEITETLIKIKAGTLSSHELDAMNFDSQVFMHAHHGHEGRYDDDDDYGGEYGDYDEEDDDYGIGNHRGIQKSLGKKGSQPKNSNKQISSVITALVKNSKKRW